jgi:hypothetical protein
VYIRRKGGAGTASEGCGQIRWWSKSVGRSNTPVVKISRPVKYAGGQNLSAGQIRRWSKSVGRSNTPVVKICRPVKYAGGQNLSVEGVRVKSAQRACRARPAVSPVGREGGVKSPY